MFQREMIQTQRRRPYRGVVKSANLSHIAQVCAASARHVPDCFQALVMQGRPLLFEVACSPDSVLTAQMQKRVGREDAAQRLSYWNGFDLTKGEGVKLVIHKIQQDRPGHVWISTECGPFSRMQQVNQRNDKQKEELRQKRENCIKQYVGGLIIYSYGCQNGIPCTWEWAETCDAWRLPMVQNVFKKWGPQMVVVKGCRVNLRDPKSHGLLGKGWKLATTDENLARHMDLPCKCNQPHVPCQGALTRRSAYYTDDFARRVCRAIWEGLSWQELSDELVGNTRFPGQFTPKENSCCCAEVRHPKSELACHVCDPGNPKEFCGGW